jgi:hypothetical protein
VTEHHPPLRAPKGVQSKAEAKFEARLAEFEAKLAAIEATVAAKFATIQTKHVARGRVVPREQLANRMTFRVERPRKVPSPRSVEDFLHGYGDDLDTALVRTGPAETLLARPRRASNDRNVDDMMTASELGKALGDVTDETVRLREKSGELFAILPPGRKKGRKYPAFQAWPEVVGAPLRKVLAALEPVDGTAALLFLTGVSDLLAGLTPLECLLGRTTFDRNLDRQAELLLSKPTQERHDVVVKAAKTQADIWAV